MQLVTSSLPLKVCNLNYLENFSGGDTGFIKQMIELFLKQVPFELKNMRTHAEEQRFNDVKQTAHKLKSSVALLGADSMAASLKQIENLVQAEGNSEKILATYEELQLLYLDAERELKGILEAI